MSLPDEQRLQFRCVSCHAKSSLHRPPFNFLSHIRGIRHAIRRQMARVSREQKILRQL